MIDRSSLSKDILDLLYILSPSVAFVPQIYRGRIIFSPLLSLVSIVSAVVKVLQYHENPYSIVLLYQSIVIIVLHFYLVANYKYPLKKLEMRIFWPSLYHRCGLVLSTAALVLGCTGFINLISIFRIGKMFGILTGLLDTLATFLQVFIYRNEKDKPLFLFFAWIVGDVVKICMMVKKYETPIEYILTICGQISLNIFVLIN
jgi:hypothetical protein